jgi:hypothetical protein
MKKKLFVVYVLAAIFGLAVLVGFISLDLDSAVCGPTPNGGFCIGECCKYTKDGCVAGPCNIILK